MNMVDGWRRQSGQLHTDLVRRDNPVELVTKTNAATNTKTNAATNTVTNGATNAVTNTATRTATNTATRTAARTATVADAAQRYPQLAVRGPLFGLAVHDPAISPHWWLTTPVADGTPQQARDALNSLLWFRARDDTRDAFVRRELLAAVAVLEHEAVNELEVLGARYRVVRGDEWARFGEAGLEPPRPTDPETSVLSWDDRHETPSADPGFVLRPQDAIDSGPLANATRPGTRGPVYSGRRFPTDVRQDSERAAETHPDLVPLPVGFGVAEWQQGGWSPHGPLRPTPHDARRLLYGMMTRTWPLIHGFDDRRCALHDRAAEAFRQAGRANEVRVEGRLLRLYRVERLVRFGPDGPETPRPSDHEVREPMKMHPTMDVDGTLRHDD